MTNYWQSKKVNFGTIRRNSSRDFEFQGLINMPEVKGFAVGCGCTKLKYDTEKRLLKVRFDAGEIPKHIEGDQSVYKIINVQYKDGTSDELIIEGTKTR